MRYTLENSKFKVEIDSFGAEIKSAYDKAEEREYMWQADAAYWGRTASVLFPFVGSLKNREFIHEGVHYPMGQHGFARDMEFAVTKMGPTFAGSEIWFVLKDNEQTMEKYPFPFELHIGYELVGKRIRVKWKVVNPADKTMYFSIGAHPAFNCPVNGESSKKGYKLFFGGVDEIHHHGNDGETGLCMDEDIVLSLEDNRAEITEEFFDRCTYMIEGKQTNEVGIETPQGERFVTVKFDMPLFALWSPEGKNAPFICIEPWCGRADALDFEGELKDRAFGNTLEAGETFSTEYDIIYGN